MKFTYEGVLHRIVFIYMEVPIKAHHAGQPTTTLTTCLISALPPAPQNDLVGSVRHHLADRFNRAIARREAFKKAIANQPRAFRKAAGHALKAVGTRLA